MPMVRRTLKPSLRAASCCNWLVVNGGGGFCLRCFLSIDAIVHAAGSSAASAALLSFSPGKAGALTVHANQPRLEGRAGLPLGMEQRVDRPVFHWIERADGALALHNQQQRHGLHTPSGKPAAHLIPE